MDPKSKLFKNQVLKTKLIFRWKLRKVERLLRKFIFRKVSQKLDQRPWTKKNDEVILSEIKTFKESLNNYEKNKWFCLSTWLTSIFVSFIANV
jgi:hypothetical protein